MLGEEILEEYIALNEQTPFSIPDKDMPVKGLLAIVRTEASSAKIIFLESGKYVRISKKWLSFFSRLGDWGIEKLPEGGFVRSMAELCYGIVGSSILDSNPLIHILKSSSQEFRDWIKEDFGPLELVGPNKTEEI